MSLTIRYKVRFGKPGARVHPVRAKLLKLHDVTEGAAAATAGARALALGHRIELAVRRGEVTSYGEAAKLLGVTATRVNQLIRLTLLAPDLQERVLTGELELSTRDLYRVSEIASWEGQRKRRETLTLHSVE